MPAPVYLSIVEIPGDGVTTQHEFNFAGGYLDQSHVKAYVQDALGAITPVTVTSGMFVNPTTLDLGVAAPVGGLTRIYRETPRDVPLVDFTGGARITEANLDTVTRQTILAVAEAFDAGAYAAVNDLLGAAAASAAASASSAASASVSAANALAQALAAAASAAEAATFNPALYLLLSQANSDAIVHGTRPIAAILDDAAPNNIAIAGDFQGNARGFQPAPAGSGVLAAGERGHDFWKAGAGGATISSTGGVNVTAGSYGLQIPAAHVSSGNYRITWDGGASCTLGDGGPAVVKDSLVALVQSNVGLYFSGGVVGNVRVVRDGAVGAGARVPVPVYAALASAYIRRHVVLPAGSAARVWRSVNDTVAWSDVFSGAGMLGTVTCSVINANNVEYRTAGGTWTAATINIGANPLSGGAYETYLYLTQDAKTNTYVRKTGLAVSNPPLTIIASSEP